ncbi:MAG: hypothetical protein IKP69_03100, partial [Oscillospiraceae bacterium]|nr:hypothetical protein [Oscillospiraceae bacterium]
WCGFDAADVVTALKDTNGIITKEYTFEKTSNNGTGSYTVTVNIDVKNITMLGENSDTTTIVKTESGKIVYGTFDSDCSALVATGSEMKQKDDKYVVKKSFTPTVTMTDWTYGATASEPSVSNNTSGGTVTYEYKVKDANDSTYSSDKPTNAGSYTVRAKIAEKDLYWDETATADFTIAKADPNVTAPTGKSLTYTGSVQTLITEGKATNGTMYYYLGSTAPATDSASWTTTAPTATSSGTYKIWYYVKGNNANYNNVAPVSVTATISSPVVSSKSSQNFTISLPSYTYDGTAHEVTISGTTYGKVITYYYDSDGHSLDEAPSEPGDYTVRVYASGNSSYYSKSVSAEYTISEPETEKYSVSVKNGTVDGKTTAEVEADTVIAVKADKAPAGYKFGYWKKDGSDRAISYNANYTFKVISDIELEAVYLEDSDDVERYGYSVKDSVEIDKTSKAISFIFMNNVPEDCTIVKCGIVATSDASKAEALALGNADYDRYKTTDKHNFRYTWTKTKVTADQTWYVKGYLIYKTADGTEKTVYSDLEKTTLEGSETIKEEKIVGTTIMTSVKSYQHQDTSKGNAIDFVSLSSVPADCTILKAGVVATSNATKAKNLTDANADYVRFMETTKHNAQYTWTKTKVTSSQTWYVKPYLVYKDADGTQYTVYGDLTTKKWS